MATGKPPNINLKPAELFNNIKKLESPKLEGNFSRTLKNFVSLCLKKDPKSRHTAS